MQEPLEATGEKQKRLTQACLVCRRKKTRCDGVKPSCGVCQRLKQTCQYGPLHQKRKIRRKHIEILEQRLTQMERLLKPRTLEESDSGSPTTNNTQSTNNNSSNMIPNSDHYIPTTLPPLNVSHGLHTSQNQHQVIDMDKSLLPPRPVMENMVQKYLERLYGVTPFFYRDDLMDLDNCPVVLQLAIAAATAKYCSDKTDQPIWFSGEIYAEKIRQRINDIVDMPSISHIQVMMLMIMHEFGCARGTRTWMYCGITGRMVLELGLHKEPSHGINDGDIISVETFKSNELRRNVFWGMYIFDRFGGASCARPVMFHDDDIDCHLPCQDDCLDQDVFYSESLDTTLMKCYKVVDRDDQGQAKKIQLVETTTQTSQRRFRYSLGWPTHMIRLISLFAQVAKFINRTLAKSTCHLAPYDSTDSSNTTYSVLSDALDDWHQQLPFHMRNTPANLERHRSEESRDTHRFLLSHILHNALVVFLNRPALTLINTIKTGNNVSEQHKEMIQLGVDKCLAASDNVSIMLTDINLHVERVFPFLTYLTYSTATVVVHTIFTGKPTEAKKAAEALKAHCLFLQNIRKYYAMADMFFFRIRDFYGLFKTQRQQHEEEEEEKKEQESALDCGFPVASPVSSNNAYPSPSATNNHHHHLLDDLMGSLDDTFDQLLDQPLLNGLLPLSTDWPHDTQPSQQQESHGIPPTGFNDFNPWPY
ncbi:fungal-specific transcription factor domain-containing protein [Chlamydoabsidia padenii]|nr:fungal-specific transcription factor domain-containing protein [Chlamydoabsidia padenii]